MLAIYCRISKKKDEGKDVSITSQKGAGIKFATEQSLPYKLFIDEGISGAKNEIAERPSFAEMFKAIQDKEITGVYCYDQSRIERNSNIWNLFVAVMLKNDCKYYPEGKLFELDDPTNRFFSGILSLSNELYASLTSKKVKVNIHINALAGKTHGLTAYGYQRDEKGYFKVEPTESEVVKKIFKLSLAGNGAYTIANMLNDEGVPTKFNRYKGQIKREDKLTGRTYRYTKTNVRWRGNVIHDMIKNPIYKGIRKWKDEEVKIPPIIDADTWGRVNRNLEKNKKKVGKRAEYRYLLNGLIQCGNCGAEYRGKLRLKGNDNAYKCVNKFSHEKCEKSRSISIPKLDTLVYKLLVLDRSFNKLLKSLPAKEDSNREFWKAKLSETKGMLDKANKKANRFYDLLQDTELADDAKLKEDYKTAKKQIQQLEAQVDNVQQKMGELDTAEKQRKKLTLSELKKPDPDFDKLRELIHSIVDSIIVWHNKQAKGGQFLVVVRFKAYDGAFNLASDWKAAKWRWIEPKEQKLIIIEGSELINFN